MTVGDVGDLDESHVRFQDSDLDEIENFNEKPVVKIQTEKNNNKTEENVGDSGDTEDVYSKVFEPSSQGPVVREVRHSVAPRPAARRKKRKEREVRVEAAPPSKHLSFDWLAGLSSEGGDQLQDSRLSVLKNMVYKLSVELGNEQSKRRDTGVQLAEMEDAPWLSHIGGLVPLLVAYEEELKESRDMNAELENIVEKNKDRINELLADNTEMATQLRDIATSGPVDFEELKVIKESAALVLEENTLLKEAQEVFNVRMEKMKEETYQKLSEAEEELSSLRHENVRLQSRNKKLEEESKTFQDYETRVKSQLSKSISFDSHTKAVNECQSAFEELKLGYQKETNVKNGLLEKLKKDLSDTNLSLEQSVANSAELEMELKITKSMVKKYEELCLSLQDKLLILAKNRAEAEEFAKKCEEDAEAAKLEAETLTRLAKQHRAAERAAERGRSEDSLVLDKLHQRINELKVSMGGRIKYLEVELRKCESSKRAAVERLEAELRDTRRELEIQRRIADKYAQVNAGRL